MHKNNKRPIKKSLNATENTYNKTTQINKGGQIFSEEMLLRVCWLRCLLPR